MKQKVMDAMQSFSKALMGPVLFLPIAGMLQAISSVMSNTALVTEGGVVWTLGKFINGIRDRSLAIWESCSAWASQ